MSRWGRLLAATAGMVVVIGGLLGLEGYRSGWTLVAAAGAAVGALIAGGALGPLKR